MCLKVRDDISPNPFFFKVPIKTEQVYSSHQNGKSVSCPTVVSTFHHFGVVFGGSS